MADEKDQDEGVIGGLIKRLFPPSKLADDLKKKTGKRTPTPRRRTPRKPIDRMKPENEKPKSSAY